MRVPPTHFVLPTLENFSSIEAYVAALGLNYVEAEPKVCLKLHRALAENIKKWQLVDARLDQWIACWCKLYEEHGSRFHIALSAADMAVSYLYDAEKTKSPDVLKILHRYYDNAFSPSALWRNAAIAWFQKDDDVLYGYLDVLFDVDNDVTASNLQHPAWDGVLQAMGEEHFVFKHQTHPDDAFADLIETEGWRLMARLYDKNTYHAMKECGLMPWEARAILLQQRPANENSLPTDLIP